MIAMVRCDVRTSHDSLPGMLHGTVALGDIGLGLDRHDVAEGT